MRAALILLSLLGVGSPLTFVLIGLILADDVLLLRATSQLAELPERRVDERQESVRNRAYRLAYRVATHAFIWPVAAIVVLASFGDPWGWLGELWRNTALIVALGTCAAQLFAFLPTLILAWTEPDPIPAG